MSEKLEGLGPLQGITANRLHKRYKKFAESRPEKHTVAPSRHFRNHEEAYKEQAILDAQAEGHEVFYPPYTQENPAKTERIRRMRKEMADELAHTAMPRSVEPQTGFVLLSAGPPPKHYEARRAMEQPEHSAAALPPTE